MGIGCLIYDIKELSPGPGWHVPEILVVASLPMLDDLHEWSDVFEGASATSRRLAPEFEIQADSKEVHFSTRDRSAPAIRQIDFTCPGRHTTNLGLHWRQRLQPADGQNDTRTPFPYPTCVLNA